VFLTIAGERHHLWRSVDQDGNVLDILVQGRHNKKAAKKFFKKLLIRLRYVPRVIITASLKSYAAKGEVMPAVEYRQSRYLNNRCENSHRPTRERSRTSYPPCPSATIGLKVTRFSGRSLVLRH
jgi:putative transposase